MFSTGCTFLYVVLIATCCLINVTFVDICCTFSVMHRMGLVYFAPLRVCSLFQCYFIELDATL